MYSHLIHAVAPFYRLAPNASEWERAAVWRIVLSNSSADVRLRIRSALALYSIHILNELQYSY